VKLRLFATAAAPRIEKIIRNLLQNGILLHFASKVKPIVRNRVWKLKFMQMKNQHFWRGLSS